MQLKLNHVTLIVSHFERSLAFYRELGFELIVLEEPRYARFICPGADDTLSIEFTGEASAPPRAQLFFECKALDETVDALVAKGFTFTQLPTDMDYLWREARLADPDGHDLRLYWAGENRLNPPWRLNPSP